MSRVAKAPITVPTGVKVQLDGQSVKVEGSQGALEWTVHPTVAVAFEDGVLTVAPSEGLASRSDAAPRAACGGP